MRGVGVWPQTLPANEAETWHLRLRSKEETAWPDGKVQGIDSVFVHGEKERRRELSQCTGATPGVSTQGQQLPTHGSQVSATFLEVCVPER